MDLNHDLLLNIIENCYRKFKNYIYFSNTLEYERKRIAEFEANSDSMDKSFKCVVDALIAEDFIYFTKLADKITIKTYIKKIVETEENEKIVTNVHDVIDNIYVDKVNFFIDLPIQLSIVDVFWTLIFGEFITNNNIDSDLWYANKFSYGLYKKDSQNILENIDFQSLNLFQQYYHQYIKWKNNAIKKAKVIHNDKKDATIISLDFSRYYYSVDIDFARLQKIMHDTNTKYSMFDFLTKIIALIYSKYSKLLKKNDYAISKHQNALPIGLTSSCVLSNYYLRNFDTSIFNNSEVIFYGRYVDDVLIVLDNAKNKSVDDIFNNVFPDVFNTEKLSNICSLSNYPRISLQKSKTKIFLMDKDFGSNILESMKNEIHPSEPRLFPSYTEDFKSFMNEIITKPNSLKIRDASESKINVKKLISAINGYFYLNINTSSFKSHKNKKELIKSEDLANLYQLFTPVILLKLCTRWNKILLFCVLHKDGNSILKEIVKTIKETIKRTNFKTDQPKLFNEPLIRKNLVRDLKELLFIAQSMAISTIGISHIKHSTHNDKRSKNRNLAIKIRKSNMMDFNVIAMPFINYISKLPDDLNLYSYTIYSTKYNELVNNSLDLRKIKFSPVFLHLSDYFFFSQIKYLKEIEFNPKFQDIVDFYYLNIGPIFGVSEKAIKIDNILSEKGKYSRSVFTIKDAYPIENNDEKVYIGLANVKLPVFDNVRKKKMIESEDESYKKKQLLKLLNEGILDCVSYYSFFSIKNNKIKLEKMRKNSKKPVSFLVFPENYLPFSWIPVLSKYSRNTGVVIVCGIKYVKINKRVFNLQVVVLPYKDVHGHSESLLFLREKNDYAPFEKEIITNSKCTFRDHETKRYYCFNHRNINFSTFICYELTDIFARALVRDYSEIIFASEYNLDISYFSNIVEATSRDIFGYVVQVNASNFGDTRIIGPFKNEYLTIAGITGGEKDSIHIGSIDMKTHRDFLKCYTKASEDNNYEVLKQDERFSRFKKPSAGKKI